MTGLNKAHRMRDGRGASTSTYNCQSRRIDKSAQRCAEQQTTSNTARQWQHLPPALGGDKGTRPRPVHLACKPNGPRISNRLGPWEISLQPVFHRAWQVGPREVVSAEPPLLQLVVVLPFLERNEAMMEAFDARGSCWRFQAHRYRLWRRPGDPQKPFKSYS